jgi:catechol 2,3-dioxygenase-like lactoylglutathione lyase family enzyme
VLPKLNHLIVYCRDKREDALYLTTVLGLPSAKTSGPFLAVTMGNEVTLDFFDWDGEPIPQHLAFLVTDAEFDQVLARIRRRGQEYWADPLHLQPNEVNFESGGRGVYFEDPSGHNLEILTRA